MTKKFCTGHLMEESSLLTVRPFIDDACAFLISRSSTGRCLIEHMHAGFGDPGFIESTWTLEVVNFSGADWVFKPGDRIVQMVMGELTTPAKRPYWMKGRYSGQIAPTPPKGWE